MKQNPKPTDPSFYYIDAEAKKIWTTSHLYSKTEIGAKSPISNQIRVFLRYAADTPM